MSHAILIFMVSIVLYTPVRAGELVESPPWDLIQEDIWAVDQDIPTLDQFSETDGINI